MRPCRATRAQAHRHRPYPSPSYFSTQSRTNKITIYTQSSPTTSTVHTQSTKRNQPFARNPPKRNRRGGARVPARTSVERRFHAKTHALCAGIERWMRPCRATRAGTQAPPLPNSTKPCGVPLPHYIVHSIAHANRTVCPSPTVLHIR